MAGIGFELRAILKKNTLLSLIEAYSLAGMISSGPWVLSILALLTIGMLSIDANLPNLIIIQYLVFIKYLMAASLILSGFFQLFLTRFIADLIFIRKEYRIVPNLLGAMLIVSVLASLFGGIILTFSQGIAPIIKALLFISLVLLSNQWLILIFLSGMKEYYRILITMMICYGLMILLSLMFTSHDLFYLMLVFTACQALLTFSFLYHVIREFPADKLLSFDLLHNKKGFYSLIFCGFFYNLGVWLDKFVFWFRDETSHLVVGLFRASYAYDLPIFIAYLAIVPGMAIFMLRMETDFSDACLKFYDSVRQGGTLTSIYQHKDRMVLACRQSIYEILKIQGMTLALLILWAKDILIAFNIDLSYLHLLYIDLVGVSFQVLVMSILNVMYYLDKRHAALFLTIFMATSNFSLSYMSIELGPAFYGYGFASTMLLTTIIGLIMLDRQFHDLEYQTFMLQRP